MCIQASDATDGVLLMEHQIEMDKNSKDVFKVVENMDMYFYTLLQYNKFLLKRIENLEQKLGYTHE